MNILRKLEDLQKPVIEIWDRSGYNSVHNRSIMNILIKNQDVIQRFDNGTNDMILHSLGKYFNLTTILFLNMDIINAHIYYRDNLKTTFSKLAMKRIDVKKDTFLKLMYQILYDRVRIVSKRQFNEYLDEKYVFYRNANDEDIIPLTIFVVIKRSLSNSSLENVYEEDYAIHIPQNEKEKWVIGTCFFNNNTFDLIEIQNFDFYLKRDYEESRNRVNIFRNFYFSEIDFIDRSQTMLFSSFLLYIIGHRNMNDLDVMGHDLSEEGKLKLIQLRQKHLNNFRKEDPSVLDFDRFTEPDKYKNAFMDVSIKNSEFWPHYWPIWLDKWAKLSNAKYFSEVLASGEHHAYFLGIKITTLKMDIQRRIFRMRPKAIADLIAFKLRYSYVDLPFEIPPLCETKKVYFKISELTSDEVNEKLSNGGRRIVETNEIEIEETINVNQFINNVIRALSETYNIKDKSISDIESELRVQRNRSINNSSTTTTNDHESTNNELSLNSIMKRSNSHLTSIKSFNTKANQQENIITNNSDNIPASIPLRVSLKKKK